MGLIGVYLAMLATFLAADAAMLRVVIVPLFQRHVGELLRTDMQAPVALGFYVFYVGGVLWLAVQPALAEASLARALGTGAVVGFLAYGTYEATNMATLRGWAWSMVATDLAWGTVLTAAIAGVGYLVGRALL